MADAGENPLLERSFSLSTNSVQDCCVNEDPELDVANEVGNMGQDLPDPQNCFDRQLTNINRRKQWLLNYQEAAIFLQEGENNDKYYTHPVNHEALPAYQVAHNHWFYCLDFFAAAVIMLLAVCERPAVSYFQMPVGVHGSIEMLCLLILSLDLGIRAKWLGWRGFLRHKRTVLKAFMIVLMLTESIVVLVRQENHFRVTRALRPLFLIHTHYCQGVRRITRQILQSMPPILDMIVLLLFFMLIFSILGFYLFSDIPNYSNFKTIQDSFVSLFVLLTTANYPDVMMPAYAKSHGYSLYFIIYLSLELYFLMNLLVAVVYDTFSNIEKTKLRSLYFHKHEGCMHAFRLLVTQSNHDMLTLKHFAGMMEFFRPRRTRKEYYLIFKSLNTSKTGTLSLEEFFSVYDATRLQWKIKNDRSVWSSGFKYPFNMVFRKLHWFATWPYFDYAIYVIIAGNFLWILIETIKISAQAENVANYQFTASWISIAFVCIYSLEASIKILGRGPLDYFTQGWDLFDFLVTVVSMIGVFGEIFDDSFNYVMVLRPFRLLRLFKIKRRFRDVLGTFFILFHKFFSLAVCIIIVYYFFAIIAMEVFLGRDLKNCCKNTSVESYYQYTPEYKGYYYLNNFDNLLISGVTLFELTVVNNWFIIMEGYASDVSEWTRLYFMSFFIVMMVVMNIVVAFVLESFMFRINYQRQMKLDDIDDHGVHKEEVALSDAETHMVNVLSAPLTGQFIPLTPDSPADVPNMYIYVGERASRREDFSLRMYSDEVEKWEEELKATRDATINTMKELRSRSRPNATADFTDLTHVSSQLGDRNVSYS